MNTAAKLGAYALGLAVVFGGTLGLGRAVGSEIPAAQAPAAAADHGEMQAVAKSDTPGGLQVSENGYTLTPLTASIKPGEPTDFRFTVSGPDGKPVTDFQVKHDKKLHFIVASRDLTSFQHLHPVESTGGVWSVKLTVPQAGGYRAFADFAPTGGTGLTLGADLFAAGEYAPKPLPAVSRTSTVDGYTVTLGGDLVPGQASKLTLSVAKDGKPVTDLQPYLGAFGHLVALRSGDLAYLHVHPEESTKAGPEIVFYAQVPSRGDYRLFLDFQHGDKVRTADFTAQADGHGAAPEAPHGH